MAHAHTIAHLPWCARKPNCWCEFWWLALVGVLSIIILLIQVPASYWYESSALAADSHHVGLDGLTIFLAMALLVVAKNGLDSQLVRDFGFWVSLGLLAVSAILMGKEAYLRFALEQHTQGYELAAVAAIGGLLNAIQLWVLERTIDTCHEHRDIRSTFNAHFLADLLNNVGMCVGGVLIEWTDWQWLDLVITAWIIHRISKMIYNLITNPEKRGKPHAH